jgi:hypothetical protein
MTQSAEQTRAEAKRSCREDGLGEETQWEPAAGNPGGTTKNAGESPAVDFFVHE